MKSEDSSTAVKSIVIKLSGKLRVLVVYNFWYQNGVNNTFLGKLVGLAQDREFEEPQENGYFDCF